MGRWLKEPLLHFILLGALLFVAYGVVSGGRSPAPSQILVTRDRIDSLAQQFQRTWQRPPSAQELDGLIQNYVREEVLYREGVALGLDRDDAVIRNRVRLKMEVLSEGPEVAEPSEAQLREWLDTHRKDFEVEPTFTFRQVYFDPARHGARLQQDAERVRARLRHAPPDAVAFHLGDVTLLPSGMSEASTTQVQETFGKDFAAALPALAIGSWEGPVQSAYGLHLVQLVHKTQARMPALDEVREPVKREWTRARTREASERYYQELRRRYTVVVEPAPARC